MSIRDALICATLPGLLGIARALQVHRQQTLQDFFIGHGCGVVAPAVGVGYGLVQGFVGGAQPRGALSNTQICL